LFPFAEENQYGYDISADGKYLIFAQITEHDRGDLWAFRLDSQEPPFPWLRASAGELNAQFSPGAQAGKWVIYTSDESGIH
jgi:Tol biopolymer transport system component